MIGECAVQSHEDHLGSARRASQVDRGVHADVGGRPVVDHEDNARGMFTGRIDGGVDHGVEVLFRTHRDDEGQNPTGGDLAALFAQTVQLVGQLVGGRGAQVDDGGVVAGIGECGQWHQGRLHFLPCRDSIRSAPEGPQVPDS